MADPTTDRCVDVTDTFERKMAALHAHVSQRTEGPEVEDRLRTWLSGVAEAAGLPAGRLAESFRVVDTA